MSRAFDIATGTGGGGDQTAEEIVDLIDADVDAEAQLKTALAVPTGAGDLSAVPTSRTVSAGTGLTGGGALSGNISFALADEAFTTAEQAKLAGIEAGATADQTGDEIVSLIDSELGSAGWQGGGSGGTVSSVNGETGDVVLDPDDLDDTSTANKFASAAQLTKVDGVETGATADQTGTEIVGLIDTELGSAGWQTVSVPAERTITSGSGLTGGGDLSADRTLALDAPSLASLALADSATQPGDLATVATTGAYADISGTPSLAAVATSGAYADVIGTPSLATVATTGAYADVIGTPTLADVATSGDYLDLTNTPVVASPFATRPAFVIAVDDDYDPALGTVIQVEGFFYRRVDAADQIPDLLGWLPASDPRPQHFGAVEGKGTDYGTELQAFIDFCKDSWNGFRHFNIDFGNGTFESYSSLDITNVRQGGITLCNGELISRAEGKIAVDTAGTNSFRMYNFGINSPKINNPLVGLYRGPLQDGAAYPVSGYAYFNNVTIDGYFAHASMVSFSSEVSGADNLACINRHRSRDAVSYANIDNMSAYVDQFGSALTSDFVTLPPDAGPNISNICHRLGQPLFLRQSMLAATILSISKANPAVVTVDSLVGADLTNGDRIHISGGTMTEVAYRTYEVAAVNEGAGTFQLVGVNSTGYTTYTGGGTLQYHLGPAVFFCGVRSFRSEGGYILTYGSPGIVWDLDNGGSTNDFSLHCQFERALETLIEFRRTSGTAILWNMEFDFPQQNQPVSGTSIKIVGAGTVQFRGCKLKFLVSNPADEGFDIFGPAGQYEFRGADFQVSLLQYLPPISSFAAFQGKVTAWDQTPYSIEYTDKSTPNYSMAGTWTPVLRDAAGGGTVAGNDNVSGTYQRFGTQAIWITGFLRNVTTGGMTGSNDLWVDLSGLPYTVANAAGSGIVNFYGNARVIQADSPIETDMIIEVGEGSQYGRIIRNGEGVSAVGAPLRPDDLVSGATDIGFSMMLRVN